MMHGKAKWYSCVERLVLVVVVVVEYFFFF